MLHRHYTTQVKDYAKLKQVCACTSVYNCYIDITHSNVTVCMDEAEDLLYCIRYVFRCKT